MAPLMLLALGAAELGVVLPQPGDPPIHYHVGWIVIEVQDLHDVADVEPDDPTDADLWINPDVESPRKPASAFGSAIHQPLGEAESRIRVGNQIDIRTNSRYDVHVLKLFNALPSSNAADRLTFGISNASDRPSEAFSYVNWSAELQGDLIDGLEVPRGWGQNTTFGRIELTAKMKGHPFRIIGAPVPEPTTLWALLPFVIWFAQKRARSADA